VITTEPILLTDEDLANQELRDRFLSYVKIDLISGCHWWTSVLDRYGYGRINLSRPKRLRLAHRVAYALFVGPIPAGAQVDHDCHTQDRTCLGGVACLHRACVNPDHLAPVSGKVNTLLGRSFVAKQAQQTHCLRNHPLAGPGADVYRMPRGGRQCRHCKRMSPAERAAERAATDTGSYAEGGASRG
jgi:hypothetical protein